MTREVLTGATLSLRNKQRDCRINLTHLRKAIQYHLEEQLNLSSYDLAIHLISSRQIAHINQSQLGHQGPTDVITFDYREPDCHALHGELLVCPAVAVAQARDFGTSGEVEILRYVIHGILHLQGYDDGSSKDRRVMKREEDRRLRVLTEAHPAHEISSCAVTSEGAKS